MSGREGRGSSLGRPLPIGGPRGRTGQSEDMLTGPRCDSAGREVKAEVRGSDGWAMWSLRSQSSRQIQGFAVASKRD